MATTRAVRADIEREPAGAVGADRVEAIRRTALDALEWAGGADAAHPPAALTRPAAPTGRPHAPARLPPQR